jgi:hypothetical protein
MQRIQSSLHDDRARLAAWLREWEADRRLRLAEPGDQPEAATRAYPVWKTRAARAPAVGAIRLLAPDSAATTARPVYVVVLADAGSGLWQVAPFSRFATPALPGELKLQRQAIHLQVICLWNTAVLRAARLAAAYPASRVTAAEWQAVTTVRASLAGATLPPRLVRRVGPALVHPLDPRQLYIEEERDLWFAPKDAVAEHAAPDLLMAAETRAPY